MACRVAGWGEARLWWWLTPLWHQKTAGCSEERREAPASVASQHFHLSSLDHCCTEQTITNISTTNISPEIQTLPNKQNADPTSCSSHSSLLQSCQRMLSASITCCQKEDDWVMSNGSLVSNIYHFLLSSDYQPLTGLTNLGCYSISLEKHWLDCES